MNYRSLSRHTKTSSAQQASRITELSNLIQLRETRGIVESGFRKNRPKIVRAMRQSRNASTQIREARVFMEMRILDMNVFGPNCDNTSLKKGEYLPGEDKT